MLRNLRCCVTSIEKYYQLTLFFFEIICFRQKVKLEEFNQEKQVIFWGEIW